MLTSANAGYSFPFRNGVSHEHLEISNMAFLLSAEVVLAQSYVAHNLLMWLSKETIYKPWWAEQVCSSVHKYVRPLPNAWFPHAAALEPASLPSWNKSQRHSHGASAFRNKAHTLTRVLSQLCPACGRCRSAWKRGERSDHTQRRWGQINTSTEHYCVKFFSWPQKGIKDHCLDLSQIEDPHSLFS